MTKKQLLDIRTVITNLDLDEDVHFNESEAEDVLLIPDPGPNPLDWKEEETAREANQRARRRVNKLPLPSLLLANVPSLENKPEEVRTRLSYQRDLKNCNILCFSELNNDMDTLHLSLFFYASSRPNGSFRY